MTKKGKIYKFVLTLACAQGEFFRKTLDGQKINDGLAKDLEIGRLASEFFWDKISIVSQEDGRFFVFVGGKLI